MVEVLVAVTLLAIGVTAMLTTLEITLSASATERDHANAHAWLQSGTDILYGLSLEDCGDETTSLEPTLRSVYETALRGTQNPEGWPPDRIRVVPPVLFWDGTVYQSTCHEEINLQLITIEVKNPNNRIIETVQVVKG